MTTDNDLREKEIQQNIQIVGKLIESRIKSERKLKIVQMLEGNFGSLYFTAPASSKDQYHYNWPGGLVSHSLNVYKNLIKISDIEPFSFDPESMLIVALFHDIGKASTTKLDTPHYLPQTEEWKLKKGWTHEYAPDLVYMPTHIKSVFVLQHFGVQLKPEEFQAIFLNDGMYLEGNKAFALKEHHLALALHMADRISLEFEKK